MEGRWRKLSPDLDDAAFALMKKYHLVRWKKRWPIILAAAIWAFFCAWTRAALNKNDTRGCVLIAVILVVIVILFPFHWGGEDWER